MAPCNHLVPHRDPDYQGGEVVSSTELNDTANIFALIAYAICGISLIYIVVDYIR